MNDIDIARLAAYIDGEGCIAITRPCMDAKNGRKYHRLVIDIANSDPRLHTWLKQMFGGYISAMRSNGNQYTRKVCFVWRIHSKAAEDLLRFCLPYFVMKKDQAELALQFRDTVTSKNGRRGMVKEVFAEREAFRVQLSRIKRDVGTLLTVKES